MSIFRAPGITLDRDTPPGWVTMYCQEPGYLAGLFDIPGGWRESMIQHLKSWHRLWKQEIDSRLSPEKTFLIPQPTVSQSVNQGKLPLPVLVLHEEKLFRSRRAF